MPRAALSTALISGLLALVVAPASVAQDPHLDPSLVPLGCAACHAGHGASRSPMLPAAQGRLCDRCHGTRTGLESQIAAGTLAPGADPPLLSTVLSQVYTHPLDDQAFSRDDAGSVTCTSCHSPHRGVSVAAGSQGPAGRSLLSTLRPDRLQHEMCGTCHGGRVGAASAPFEVGALVNPANRSYHPVVAPAMDRSVSVQPGLSGRIVNCTDCHGNDDPSGPRGPHGSSVPHLLLAGYRTLDGSPESPDAYALCYRCHDRESVLSSSSFPEHESHVVEERASCATCHDPHGSVNNRALVRFGNAPGLNPSIAPSGSTGRLEFVSTAPGSGACYLTCHGRDDGPEAYGSLELQLGDSPTPGAPERALPRAEPPLRRSRPPEKPPTKPLRPPGP